MKKILIVLSCIGVLIISSCNSKKIDPVVKKNCNQGKERLYSTGLTKNPGYVSVSDSSVVGITSRTRIIRSLVKEMNDELEVAGYQRADSLLAEKILGADVASRKSVRSLINSFTLYITEGFDDNCQYKVIISYPKRK